MNVKTRVELFLELVRTSHNLYLWDYDGALSLRGTDCPYPYLTGDVLPVLGIAELLRMEVSGKNKMPCVLDNDIGLLWLAVLRFDAKDQFRGLFLVGPFFSGRTTPFQIRKRIERLSLPVSVLKAISDFLPQVPIIPNSLMSQYALMLHRCVYEETVSFEDIRYLSAATVTERDRSEEDLERLQEEHGGVYLAERKLLAMIRSGNPDYRTALGNSSALSSGVRSTLPDSLRVIKNNLITLLTLASRAAIDGGLNPAVAYSLNDLYMDRIEECKSLADARRLSSTLLDDFVERVRTSRLSGGISAAIQTAKDYIDLNLSDDLSVPALAERFGYAPYYFSRKFEKETGIALADYIRFRRIERAKELLKNSALSVAEIMAELNFKSRATFVRLFRDSTGMTPQEYREK